MNIPFKLALSTSHPYGVLWTPWSGAAAVNGGASGSVQNTILTNLTNGQQSQYNLLPPLPPVWVTSISLMGDTAAQQVSFGVWDATIATPAFVELYAFTVPIIAGQPYLRFFGKHESGLYLPLDKNHIPVFKLTSGSGLSLQGDIGVFPDHSSFGPGALNSAGPTSALLDDPTGLGILDETGAPVLGEP